MNTGQMMLTIGAMALLSITSLRVNRNIVDSGFSLDESKFNVLAVSLATSVIEEANNKSFDEKTTDDAVITPSGLSTVLGKDSLEVYPDFDDCDDYNNYTRVIDSIPSATFNIKCKVNYVNPTSPDVNTGTPKFHKKITVFVTSPSMKDTLKLSSIYSYWYFR